MMTGKLQEGEPKHARPSERGRTDDLKTTAFPSTKTPLTDEDWLEDLVGRQGVSQIIAEACVAFRKELPRLLHDGREGQWAAYHGPQCVGFGPSKTDLYRKLMSQGVPRDDLYVRIVGPQMFYGMDLGRLA